MTKRVGQQIGNYHLLRLLGQGGFADVYLGEHVYLKTQAAIKILHAQLTQNDIEPFLKEAQTIAHLEHPHIIHVLDFGVDGTTPFLVMSYAPGGTLRDLHPKGSRLPPSTVISYINQIAPALQYAHDQKLIHRDVKPENFLVGRNNEIVISDFGIALIAQSSHSQTAQDIAGTVAYMAPEQIRGLPKPASDQYSLGIVVYEWLSGERPFSGTFTEIAVQQAAVPPPSLHEKILDLPVEVENAVMTALAKEPKARFPSVLSFARALEQASQQAPSNYGPPFPQSGQYGSREETYKRPPPGEAPGSLPSSPVLDPPVIEPAQKRSASSQQKRPYKSYLLIAGLVVLLVAAASLGVFYIRGQTPSSSSPNTIGHTQPGQAGSSTGQTTAPVSATTQVAASGKPQAIATLDSASTDPYASFGGKLALNDPLTGDAGNWDTSSSCQFTGGAYHVKEGTKTNTCLYASANFTDFVFQARVTFVSDSSCGGLIFRASNSFILSYYDFYICTDGTYRLDRFSTIGSSLRNGSSDVIQATTGASNVLAVAAKGMNLDVFINGKHIASVSDNGATTGQVGFIVGSLNGSGAAAEATFNDAKVWTL